MKVKCPKCGQPTEFTPSNVFRPFCSERCQLIDLGAWADEQYRVPAAPASPGDVRESTPPETPPKHQLN